jgi:class 3 adenylate cyclase/tetratricopeptide (TPR) repeat protein
MKCPSCDADNKDGRKFCAECGTPLPLPCSDCGFENDVGDKFCGGCGRALGEGPPAATVAPEQRTAERRQVTILFVDISGFTALSADLGAENTHRLLGRFFDLVDGVVGDYGGTIDKHIGDAVMALFGAPVAHSNDPERAVRTALQIHGEMTRLSEEFGREIRVHNGVASGQVVASGLGSSLHSEYTVLGDSVNLASRLSDQASGGETLVSDDVAYAVQPIVDAEPIGNLELKGIEGTVTVWRVDAVKESTEETRDTPFVGRREELSNFTDILSACLDGEGGHTIYLRSEAGMGKSRLGEEFRTRAAENGFICHTGQELDFGASGSQGVAREIVRSVLGISPTSEAAERINAAQSCLETGSLQPEKLPHLYDLLDIPLEDEMRVTYDAIDNTSRIRGKGEVISALLSWYAAKQPLLLVAEDIHWARAVGLDYLTDIAAVTAEHPIILVMTSRFDGDPLSNAWYEAVDGVKLTAMDLQPLAIDDAWAMAADHATTDEEFTRSCIARAEGNPLFLEQLLHSGQNKSGTEVPGTVQSIVLARVDSLTDLDRTAIQAASTLGQIFTVDIVRHLISNETWEPDALLHHRLVRSEGENLRFAHALIWEGVYVTLLSEQQRKLHRRAAKWFAKRDKVLRAEHLDRAGAREAAGAYLAAAREERLQFRFERAEQLAARGLELARDFGERYELLMLRGECQTEMGRPADAILSHREALENAKTDTARCRAWLGLAGAMRVTDEFEEGLEVLDQAEAAATGDKRLLKELSHVHYLRGSLYFPLGNIEGCMREHETALAIAREAGQAECEANALSGLGDAYYSQGRMITALDYYRRCVDLSQAHGFGRIEFSNRYMIGWNRLYLNEIKGSYEDSLQAAEAANRAGHARGEMVARLAVGRALFELGKLDEADKHLARGEELAQSLGARRFEPFLRIYQTRVALARSGPSDTLMDSMERALEVSRDTGFGFLGPWVLSTLALAGDDAARGRAAIEEGTAALAEGCVGHNYFAFNRDAMAFALRYGEWDQVDVFADALIEYSRAEPLPFYDFFIERGRALATWGRGGRDEETKALLQDCRNTARSIGLMQALPLLDEALNG